MSAEVHHDHDKPKDDKPEHDEHDEPKDEKPEHPEHDDDSDDDTETEGKTDKNAGKDDKNKAEKSKDDDEGTSGLGVVWGGMKALGRGVKKGATKLDSNVKSKSARIAVPVALVAGIAGLVWKAIDRPPPPEVIAPMSDTELREFIKEVYNPNHVEVHKHITFKISAKNFQFKLEGVSAESIQNKGQTISTRVDQPTDATPLPYYTVVSANRDAFGTPMISLQFTFVEKGKRCVYETERLVLDRRDIANFPLSRITAHLIGTE